MSNRSVSGRAEKQLTSAVRIGGLLFALLMAGCAGLERGPVGEPPQLGATGGVAVAPEPVAAPPASTVEPASVPAKPHAADVIAPHSAGQPAAKTDSPATAALAKGRAAPAPAAPPPLDLKSLETRLKETKAIGVITKLTLKNQVDDLLNQFRAYYQGRVKTTLAELRRPYDMLILKVLALLQDTDPPLAGAIVASREAIWGILADPVKFATF